jgi:hypothetical protein
MSFPKFLLPLTCPSLAHCRAALLLSLFLCACAEDAALTPTPAETPPAQDMQVVAYLVANTGGDVGVDDPDPYKLELYLEFNDPDSNEKIVVKERIARCGQMSSGTVFADKTERLIDVTLCEAGHHEGIEHYAGIYWLISEPGELTVRKGWLDHPQKIITTYKMPAPHIRAIAREK